MFIGPTSRSRKNARGNDNIHRGFRENPFMTDPVSKIGIKCFAALLTVLLVGGLVSSAFAADSRYFEWRVYEVTPKKLEAVLDRFRDHVDRIRFRHGIETLGSWITTNKAGADVFVYLLSAPNEEKFRESEKAFNADKEFQRAYAASTEAHGKTVEKITSYPIQTTEWSPAIRSAMMSPPRAFELRIYDVLPEKMTDYLSNYRDARLRLFEKHGFSNLGFWTTTGTNQSNKFIMLLSHQTGQLIDDSKTAYHSDPEWKSQVDEWNKRVGKTTTNVLSFILKPTDFSKWK
jgi:hypothetical protein